MSQHEQTQTASIYHEGYIQQIEMILPVLRAAI